MRLPRYHATIIAPFPGLGEAWARHEIGVPPTPFQSREWLEGWYAAFTGTNAISPLLIELVDEEGRLAYLLPLILREEGNLRRIEFADFGATDYNLPVPGIAFPTEPAAARAAWLAVKSVLPEADICHFVKMPAMASEMPNPILAAIGGDESPLIASHVAMSDDYDQWLKEIGRHARKEFGRFWRVFTRTEETRFLRVTEPAEAERLLRWIETQQNDRAARLALSPDDFRLDRPEFVAFYRKRLAAGLTGGSVILTALMAGSEIVAGLYGLSDGTHYAMVRIAVAGGEWAQCSPGKLVIERSIHHLHQQGYRWFDFTTGDYAYKRAFNTKPVALFDRAIALTMRGLPKAGLANAKAFIRKRPALAGFARRILALGRRPAHTGSEERAA